MKSGIGGLGWRPADFWAATLTEFFSAIHGYNEANGGADGAPKSNAPTTGEMAMLLARYG